MRSGKIAKTHMCFPFSCVFHSHVFPPALNQVAKIAADIGISEASPSGVTLAQLLEVNRVDYMTFEREPRPGETGQRSLHDIHRVPG